MRVNVVIKKSKAAGCVITSIILQLLKYDYFANQAIFRPYLQMIARFDSFDYVSDFHVRLVALIMLSGLSGSIV